MSFSKEDVAGIAKLMRIKLSDQETDTYSEQISRLIKSFAVLAEVNTEGIEPTSQPFDFENLMDDDVIEPSLPVKTVLLNAPENDGENIVIRAIME